MIFTPERRALVLSTFRKIRNAELLKRLNALPGPAVNLRNLTNFVCRRYDVFTPHPEDRGPIIAGYWRVASWAFEQGIEFSDWSDLPAVNERAFAVGHPGFARELPVHRAARLRRAA